MKQWITTLVVVSSMYLLSASAVSMEESPTLSEEYVWISIGSDAVSYLRQEHSGLIELNDIQQVNTTKDSVALVRVPASQLDTLSHFMHENFRRCGGYALHQSLAEAQLFARDSLQTQQNKLLSYTIDNAATVNALFNNIVPLNMSATVSSLSNYNNRYYQQTSGVQAATWIKDHWTSIAASRSDITVEFFQHSAWQQPSVIATITGASSADEIVVVGGHLDSINGASPANGRAPGADDNASGIAVVTETLSAIVASGYRPAKTIKLMGYAAEEVGLRGSQEIAQLHKTTGLNVIGVAQFDMTGFYGTASQKIVFMNDFTNVSQNNYMAQLIDTYLPETTYGFDPCGYACSDHASWHRAGFPASFPFESKSSDYNGQIHTSNDKNFDVNHATHFLKLAVAYVAEMAKGTVDGVVAPAGGNIQFANSAREVEEGNEVILSIQRVAGTSAAVTVDYATQDGTAIAGSDYTPVSGTLTWDENDSSVKTITLTTAEVDSDKLFTVILSNPQGGAGLGSSTTISITIKNKVDTSSPEVSQQSSGGGSFALMLLGMLALIGYYSRQNISNHNISKLI